MHGGATKMGTNQLLEQRKHKWDRVLLSAWRRALNRVSARVGVSSGQAGLEWEGGT